MKRNTKRTRAKATPQESEEKFRALLEFASVAIVVVDSNGRIVFVNAKSEEIFGYNRHELNGQAVEMLLPEHFRDAHLKHRTDYLAKPRVRPMGLGLELAGRRKDGTEFPVEIGLSFVKTQSGMLVICFITEITERKRVKETVQALYQASLQTQESLGLPERLQVLLRTAQTVLELDRVNILLADSEQRWLQAVASTGTTEPLEAIRVPIGPTGGGVAQAYQTRQPVVWDGRAGMPEAMRLQPPYDRIGALRSRVFANLPLVVHGRAIGVLGADRKHSRRPLEPATLELLQLFAAQAALAIEHARLYEEQRVVALHLEEMVDARTQELEDANARLQEALRRAEQSSHTKSNFLATMSHELRTPLNAIIGFSELLQEQQFGSLNEKQRRYVGHVLAGGQHLLSLINSILDLAKVEAGKLELVPEPFPLPETIKAILDSLRPQAKAKGLHLRLTLETCPSTLVADPVRFRQILYNLFSNALKFTPEGGHITVTSRSVEPDAVEIAVQDTGVGINARDLPKLFQPFTQLDASLSRREEGTGLGLALTKKLVELHGGAIRVESRGERQGCTFTVTLPLESPSAPSTTPQSSPKRKGAKAFAS